LSLRFKATVLLALVVTIPSIIEFSNGYLSITSLLERLLVTLVVAFVAVGVLSAVIAAYRIENLQRAQLRANTREPLDRDSN
jgi:ribose/xylose/arabinose/galactoside ABC-type transport system permease subunit